MGKVEQIDNRFSLVGDGRILVDLGDPLNLGEIKKQPATPKQKEQGGGDDVAPWGDDNDFPQKLISVVEQSTEIAPLLDWQARAMQGREVIAVQRVYDDDSGKFVERVVNDEEIDDFLQDTTTKRYMRESSLDFFYFWNVFPELIKSVKGDKIAYIGTQDASFCRWSKQDNNGIIRKCYVNANWPDAKSTDKETIKYPVIDPYSTQRIEDVRNSKDDRFIYPISYPSPGKVYYQLSKWHGFIVSGWADIARSIPQAKKSMMKRILSAKYILRIPINYWPAVYPDWKDMTSDQKLAKKKEKLKEINDQLTGMENAGKTIMNEFGKDMFTNQDVPAWEIVEIESNTKSGEHLEDSREASEHLMRAVGVDPTLVGDGPGKKMGGGSGSDKRIAFNIYVALLQAYRDVILEPLYFIAEYNGWRKKYKGLKFKTVEVELQTLDQGNTAKETTN